MVESSYGRPVHTDGGVKNQYRCEWPVYPSGVILLLSEVPGWRWSSCFIYLLYNTLYSIKGYVMSNSTQPSSELWGPELLWEILFLTQALEFSIYAQMGHQNISFLSLQTFYYRSTDTFTKQSFAMENKFLPRTMSWSFLHKKEI